MSRDSTSIRIEKWDHLFPLGRVLTYSLGIRYVYVGRVLGSEGFIYCFQPEVVQGRRWSIATWSLMPTLLKHFPELVKETQP